MMMTQLYHVTSIVKELHGHKDVLLTWFMPWRKQPVGPYVELISGYGDLDERARMYAEPVVDEMLTIDEAHALLAWLREHDREGDTHALGEPRTVPVRATRVWGAGDGFPIRMIGTGGPEGWVRPNADNWDLPFETRGYYDLSRHDSVDGTPPDFIAPFAIVA
jgi:hypothetical protein